MKGRMPTWLVVVGWVALIWFTVAVAFTAVWAVVVGACKRAGRWAESKPWLIERDR